MTASNITSGSIHSLVIGGTGMLRGVSLHLAKQGHTVSVIARRRDRLHKLEGMAAEFPGQIYPLALDYRDSDALGSTLFTVQNAIGPISLVVSWIHTVAPNAPGTVAEQITRGQNMCRFFHVCGSAAARPNATPSAVSRQLRHFDGLLYREVILGFIIEGGYSRWLTHDEISDGIIEAIEADRERTILGTVEPWSMRP